MNSNPTTTNTPRKFTAKKELLQAVASSVRQESTAQQPYVISIVGGSASGKTTVAKDLAAQFGPEATILSQDLFQFGDDFVGRKTSRYKWDDPDNFDLPNCAQVLAKLRNNEPATVPNYEVVANRRLGTIDIQPKPILIWEGIYASLSPELRELSDLVIYIEVPYIVRFVRRIARFLARKEIDDMTVPARHMLSFVLRADVDYVSTQKQFADYVLAYNPKYAASDTATLQDRAARHTMGWDAKGQAPIKRAALADITLELYNDGFTVRGRNNTVLYAVPLDKALAQEAAIYWDKALLF